MVTKVYIAVLVVVLAVVATRFGQCGSLRKIDDVNHKHEGPIKRESGVVAIVAREDEECPSAPNAIAAGFPCCTGFTTREQCNDHGTKCAFLKTGCVFQCAFIYKSEDCAAVSGCKWVYDMICMAA